MALWDIKLARGKKANLPQLSLGEPAYVTDEGELYIGGVNGENINITNNAKLNALEQNANKIWNKEVLTFVPTVDYSLIYNESYKVGNLIIINAAIKRTDESIINGNFNVGIFQGIKNNNIKSLSTTSHSDTTVTALNGANSKGLIGISGDVWVSITGTNDTKGVVISTVFVEGGN